MYRTLIVFVSLMASSTAHAQDIDLTQIERGVRATLDAQVAAWIEGDIPGFMDGYVRSDDLRFASGGEVRRGWQTTLDRFQASYDSREKMGTLRFTDIEVLPLSDSAAEVFGRFHLSRSDDVGDAEGLFTLLMIRQGERWLVLHDHTSAATTADSDADDADPALQEQIARINAEVETELKQNLQEFAAFDRANESSVSRLGLHGDLMFFSGNYKDAVADYQQMTKRDPSTAASHWRLGIALYYAERYEDAAAVFDAYHSFDQVDRENGIWRYLCHHRAFGEEKAANQLLRYEKDDRPPFPHVYRLFDGGMTVDEVLAAIPDDLSDADREARLFYIHLYAGLHAVVRDQPDAAIPYLQQAVLNSWPRRAGFGPRYMWHVGRRQLLDLQQSAADPQAE